MEFPLQPPVSTEGELETHRIAQYWSVAAEKRKGAAGGRDYYASLLAASRDRTDSASSKDRRQINKDLPRTFQGFETMQGKEWLNLLPLLFRILTAYIERGRALCSTSKRTGVAHSSGGRRQTQTSLVSRCLINGYPQGLNFLAGMSLIVAGAVCWDGSGENAIEETAFWLLALLLEDVLDPDFFGADVKGNLQMAYIGGLGMRSLIVDRAETGCPVLFDALGREAFDCSLSAVLDQWVLSLFIGCAPFRLLNHLWDHLLLPSPYHQSERGSSLPRGLATLTAFTLAALRCCGDERLAGSEILKKLRALRIAGSPPEDISLEAGEAIKSIRDALLHWPAEDDIQLLNTAAGFMDELAHDEKAAANLWHDVRQRKQRIADCAGNLDDQLMALARQTHFTQGEIQHLREEFQKLPGAKDGKVDLPTFKKVVSAAVPEFPLDLCGRLFDKLDAFRVGRLTFVELVCGMSALSLGTMDEKLQVCFDLFDSEGHRALTLKDLGDLCTVLFRVALAQGFHSAKKATCLEDIEIEDRPSPKMSRASTRRSSLQTPRSFRSSSDGMITGQSSSFVDRQQSEIFIEEFPMLNHRADSGEKQKQEDSAPWRSMLLRLLAAAQVRTPGGPWLVAFEDFRQAAHMEPALLCLFAWCLPRPPAVDGPKFASLDISSEFVVDPARQPSLASRLQGLCGELCKFLRSCECCRLMRRRLLSRRSGLNESLHPPPENRRRYSLTSDAIGPDLTELPAVPPLPSVKRTL